MFLTTKIIKCS